MTAEGNGKQVTGPGVALVQAPDKFRLEVQDPVGGTIGLLVVNGGQFWLYQSGEKEILTGPMARFPLSVALPFKGSGREIVQLFLACPPWSDWKDPDYGEHAIVATSERGVATVSWSDRLREPELWRTEYRDGSVSEVLYENYTTRAGQTFPGKVAIHWTPKQGENLRTVVDWRDWQPSVREEKKLFQIPQQERFGRKIKALH